MFAINTVFCKTHGIKPVALEELLAQSDLVTLHVPLDESTRGILTEQRLALMKPTAVLLNAAAVVWLMKWL